MVRQSVVCGHEEPPSLWWLNLLVAILAVVVSFVVGGYLGKKLRMPDHGWKIGLCLVTLLGSVAILLLGPPLKLGIDLSGGAILVYEVDQSKKATPETLNSQQMDNLISAVGRRVNPSGVKEVTIRKYGAEQVEIIIPEKDAAQVERIEGIISRTGSLSSASWRTPTTTGNSSSRPRPTARRCRSRIPPAICGPGGCR